MSDSARYGLARRGVLALAAGALGLGALAVLSGCSGQIGVDTLSGRFELGPHPTPPAAEGTVFLFLPLEGLPVNTADNIYRQIRAHAAKAGLKLAVRLDEPATYRVRGVLAALGTGTSTVTLFQIEIYDATGRRLTRFSGQEVAAATTGDPWSGVDSTVVDHIGTQIVEGVKVWVTRAGS